MIAVLTGDIKNSTGHEVQTWMPLLKEALNRYGKEPSQWEIYRGDSFQLEVIPEKALEAVIYTKACLKQKKGVDVRIGIGLGKKEYSAKKITESNGEAYVNSGKCFEKLKKQNLGIKSPKATFDQHMNLLLAFALLTMDHWTPVISKTVKVAMENAKANQKELAAILGKSQGNISEELNKAGFDEVKKMIQFYTTQLKTL